MLGLLRPLRLEYELAYAMLDAFEYSHVVSFEETNLVGNVYFANHIRWQGKCREMFLRQYTPEILQELSAGLALVTTRVSCEYFSELWAFDQVIIRMRMTALKQNRITMGFEYFRQNNGADELVARGEQEVACLRREGNRMVAEPIPVALREALRLYQAAPLAQQVG